MCRSVARPSIRAFPTEKGVSGGRVVEGGGEGATIATIQEGEKEKDSQHRKKMPIEFPKEFPLVD